jgi:hypothetical protein
VTSFHRYTETAHPQRRTTFKELFSVGRRMMYAIHLTRVLASIKLCNSLCMGFEKFPDPIDLKERELLHACNAILFPPGQGSFSHY